MMKKKIVFIINPISGTGKQKVVEKLIEAYLDCSKFEHEIWYTQHAGHAKELSLNASAKGFDIIVAVGGDGSVNETGSSIIGGSSVLGIVPTGSGNGLARHLQLPMDLKEAVLRINNGVESIIDTGLLNGEIFLGTAGLGFDAHIGKKFDEASSRGFFTYVKLSFAEYFKYKEQLFKIEIDGIRFERKAFLLSFCNSNQWGNDAFISPHSDVSDGQLRIIVIKKMSLLAAPFFVYKLFRKKLHTSRYYEELKGKHINVLHSTLNAHLDGEPISVDREINVKVVPASLKVIS